ncbi:MAG: hypothetical protein J6F31_00470 [Oscillospiraceae bacterium]|nr:hypothetical protein [Oscillospiraceae bacterium]
MLYDQMFRFASDAVAQSRSQGAVFSPYDTVCVIVTGSGRFYTGFSGTEMMNGSMVGVHAEVNAVRQALSMGENFMTSLLLLSSANLSPILPCAGCVQFILSQNPANNGCQIVLPDGMMPLTQILSGGAPQTAPVPAAPQAGTTGLSAASSGSSLLKARVGNLMDIDDEDEDEDEPAEKKGFFGKLFGKK